MDRLVGGGCTPSLGLLAAQQEKRTLGTQPNDSTVWGSVPEQVAAPGHSHACEQVPRGLETVPQGAFVGTDPGRHSITRNRASPRK